MTTLEQKVIYANKRTAYAWSRYYGQVNNELQEAHVRVITYTKIVENVCIPTHIKNEMKEMATVLQKKWECPVCLDMIDSCDLEITNCGHFYCKDCLESWKKAEEAQGKEKWKCAVCNRKHTIKQS